MNSIQATKVPTYGYSEVSPFDDLRNLSGKDFNGFGNKTKTRNTDDILKWAKDTDKLATRSIYSYLAELPLKIVSYFVSHSDFKDTAWSKVFASCEDITGTLGDMFRNQIYSHKDSKGGYDDNIGAEAYARALNTKETNHTLGAINNLLQTKGKFLVAALSLINPTLSNDLEWAVVRATNGCWWRNMSSNIAFGPGFETRLCNQLFGFLWGKSNKQDTEKITFNSIFKQIKGHIHNACAWRNKSKNTSSGSIEELNISRLNFYKYADKTVSSFIPVVNWFNITGNILRPIFRRLKVEGFSRNCVRLLSVIDRPFFWATNFFRYYLPEKLTQTSGSKEHGITDVMDSPKLLLTSMIGDAVDFGTLIFEDSIKESSGMINHLVEVTRRVTQSASDIYFSARRKQAARDLFVKNKT